MNRSISTLAVVLLLVAAAQPVAGACCPQASHAGAMMTAMPCCAARCPVMKAAPHQSDTAAILSAPAANAVIAQTASVTLIVPAPAGSFEIASVHQESPPPFLLHQQFRI